MSAHACNVIEIKLGESGGMEITNKNEWQKDDFNKFKNEYLKWSNRDSDD